MKKSSIAVALLGVVIGVLLCLLAGQIKDRRNMKAWKVGQWRKLSLVLDYVEKNYVDTIDMKAMTDAAIEAALAKLDPHSTYMPPVELAEAETELKGNFDGIGIQFNVPNDTAIVLNVIAGGPSEKAGLMQGDRIIQVDERVIAGRKTPQDSMVMLMKGPSGTKVDIHVLRGEEKITFNITRGKIPVNCVDAAFMVNDTTGYIKLSKFTRTTYSEVLAATAKLLNQGMQKLIFDIRDNSGGYLDQAASLSNLFLDKGDMIVYMEGDHRKREEQRADGKGLLKSLPLCVLIDEGSASSSEIFAGAIQDNDRGTIIGRRSFGKGLVQEPVYFTDGSGIRLTVARFYTPSGRCIQKPYGDDYNYDVYERYIHGELTNADSVKVNKDLEYKTVGGRTVYGGGGIVPDIFVPMDTTKATSFYLQCSKKATAMRFASAFFDSHRSQLMAISDFATLSAYLDGVGLDKAFLKFAAEKDGIVAGAGAKAGSGANAGATGLASAEWAESSAYMMPQIKGLVGRYSQVGEEAFYHFYLDIDDCLRTAIAQ